MKKYILVTLLTLLISQIPDRRVVAEWEPALGTMIRWPLGIPSDLVVELASDDIIYVTATQEERTATCTRGSSAIYSLLDSGRCIIGSS